MEKKQKQKRDSNLKETMKLSSYSDLEKINS